MKVVLKLTAAFFVAACAILTVNGVLRVRRELALFETRAAREHRSVGRALRSSLLEVWRTENETRALQLVDEANATHGRIQFRWVFLDGAPKLHTSLQWLRDAPEGSTETVSDRSESGKPMRYTYVTATTPDHRRGALELVESLDEQRAYLQKTVVEAFITGFLLLLVSGGVVLALGYWFVGRPVRALVDKARRIGEGDFTRPLDVRGNDEIAALAGEINATCDRLVEARSIVDAQTRARIAALEQLRHADRLSTVGKLASGLAHELGTPMNVISGRAEMIATREAVGDEAIDSAEVIARSAAKVTAIIRQLLDFARRRGPQRADYDIGRLAAQTVELLRPMAEKKGAAVELSTEDGLVTSVDAGQLQQALTNLVVNAIHAIPRRGRVFVSCTRDSERIVVAVRDDGPGIAPDDLPRVFDPFFTTKNVGEGTGLGLSVALGIVADHNGTLDVESTPGQGATFTISLPVTEAR